MTGFAKIASAAVFAALAPLAATADAYRNDAGPLVTGQNHEQAATIVLQSTNDSLQATYRNDAGPLVTSEAKADLQGNAPVVTRNNQPVTGSNSSGAIILNR